MVTVYLYGLDLISQIRGEEQDFYHVDGLGSIRALSDETGNVTDTYDYEAFGELVDSSGESENSYLFAGEQFDGGLGQYYLRQRYYDAGFGRFTRRDTYEGDIYNPVSLHKYLYANADPVNGIDPSGLVTLAEISAARQIRNTLAEIQLDSYSYLVFATLGGEEPTPKSINLGVVFELTLLTLLPAAVLAVPVIYERVVRRGVGGFIRNRSFNRIGVCDQCARELRKNLIENQISGRWIRIETGSNRGAFGNIWDEGTQQLISFNGYHEANVIKINGQDIVFDNVYPEGKEFQRWLDDLDSPGNITIVRDESF